MALTKLKVEVMNKELDVMLAAFAAKHGLTKGAQKILFNEATCKFTVEFGDKATTGDMNPVYFRDCARKGFMYGLSTSQIGKEVKTSKGMMKFVGMRGKFAIVQDTALKFWKYDPVMIAALLKAA